MKNLFTAILGERKSKKGKMKEEKLLVASQWQLMRWKFLRHKLAVVSLVVLGVLYFFALFAEFTAPNNPRAHNVAYIYVPPQPLRFFDEEGNFHLRPFVYGVTRTLCMRTFRHFFEDDHTRKYSLHLFVPGEPWGFLASNIRLFGFGGADGEGRVMLLGADSMGRCMLSRLIYGGRLTLSVGLIGIAISFVLGIIIGGISGYFGGTADAIIQRLIEFLMSIPGLPLFMALSAALPVVWPVWKRYFMVIIILSIIGWTGLARVVRGKFMSTREEDFVMAARLHGASESRIISKHLLPSFYSFIIASLTLSVPGMILGETGLSFIGLGLQPPAISWGVLLAEAQALRVLAHAPWLIIPGLAVVIAVLAFNFVGDGLRDAADPYANV